MIGIRKYPTCPGEVPSPPRPENKRVWASLLKSKTAVIEEVAAEMDRRDPARSATRLALTDGERALQIRVEQKLQVTLILDLMHVLEKLWKAAYVFHAEGSARWWLVLPKGFAGEAPARRLPARASSACCSDSSIRHSVISRGGYWRWMRSCSSCPSPL